MGRSVFLKSCWRLGWSYSLPIHCPGLLTDPSYGQRAAGLWHRSARACQSKSVRLAQSLARGFPLVKKHVLFQLVEHQGQPMAIAELAGLIPKERLALLTRDIEQLLISRYSGGSPRMG